MKDRRLLLGIAVLVLALAGGIAWSLRDSFEKVEVDVETGYKGAARVNPLYAAEQLYKDLGACRRAPSPERWSPCRRPTMPSSW